MIRRPVDLVVSILASVVAFALSWPFWREFEHWADSQTAWMAYFGVGFILAVYVFYAFMNSLRTLFLHDVWAREKAEAQAKAAEEER